MSRKRSQAACRLTPHAAPISSQLRPCFRAALTPLRCQRSRLRIPSRRPDISFRGSASGRTDTVADMERVAASLRSEWGIEDAGLSPLTGGMNSQTWLVEHGGVRYVAKVVSPGWLDGLNEGCLAAARLAEQGFQTGRPIPTTSGELVSAHGRMALLE